MGEGVQVFLSWSGRKSHDVALALKSWLPEIINDLDPWMSSEDIEPGRRWSGEIAKVLKTVDIGIICLTRENQDRVWVNYEAGAVAKAMLGGDSKARAATFLIDIEKESEVTGPLAQFQHTRPNEADVLRLTKSLNSAAGSPRTSEQLARAVTKWWPDLESAIAETNTRPGVSLKKPVRSEREILEEILTRVRDIASSTSDYRRQAPSREDPDSEVIEKFIRRARSAGLSGVIDISRDGDRLTLRTESPVTPRHYDRLLELGSFTGLDFSMEVSISDTEPQDGPS